MVVYVITHKNFDYHSLQKGYVPLLVGAYNKKNKYNFLTDNTGDNISQKNKYFCEETGLYWIWKHSNDNKVGISHYRRFFSDCANRKMMYLNLLLRNNTKIISVKKLDRILSDGYQWILSQPEHGGDGTLWNQFASNHNLHDLEVTEATIRNLTPEYSDAFGEVMKHRSTGSFYNMFYTTHEQLNLYCEWLFKILFAVEKKTDVSNYDDYQQRLYGFLAERLLNVWICKNKSRVKYLPVFETEKMNRNYVLNILKKTV